jgi:hypothetical protein
MNKSLIKTGDMYNRSKVNNQRPKKISDSDWNEVMSEFRMNKLIVLDAVPKQSRKSEGLNQDK